MLLLFSQIQNLGGTGFILCVHEGGGGGGGGGSVKLGTAVFSRVLKHDKQNLVQLSLQQRREIFKIRRGMLLRRK